MDESAAAATEAIRLTRPRLPWPRLTRPRLTRPWLALEVAVETRWSFTRPWTWLTGVVLNLALSLIYLLAVPLTGHHRRAWVVLLGTYFVNFILADVTTTNIFGADPVRTPRRLAGGESIRRLLLVKNLTLMLVVAVPTLVLTTILTEDDTSRGLLVTLPAVAFPVFCWLAFGDIVSVVLPVEPKSMRYRWRHRTDVRATTRWLVHLILPYGLYFLVEVVRILPRTILTGLPHSAARTPAVHGVVLAALGLAIWATGLLIASALVTRRGLRMR